jgi:phosphoribosyl 1,2-cyclic phosphodiesterase
VSKRSTQYSLTIWGARGTVPTPDPGKLRYGGHTCCLAAAVGESEYIVLDCGSGVRPLGQSLVKARSGKSTHYHILFSHYHLDHVEGLPYFLPLYDPESWITFYGFSSGGRSVQQVLETLMAPPYFPVRLDSVPARIDYVTLTDQAVEVADIRIDCLPLVHPDGSLCYRLDRGGNRVIFATDHEYGDSVVDEALVEFSRGAKHLIYDTTYEPHEYESLRKGWGHSTWYAAVQTAMAAGVENLVLFHHHPDYTDDELAKLCDVAKMEFPNTEIASEGRELPF